MQHSSGSIFLGINIDHVATLRQARGTSYPDPLYAALIAEQSGADSITLHLREDRRHIQDRDVRIMRDALQTRMNLEMACTAAMIDFAASIKPQDVCLVPEKRAELTTEGGLDVVTHFAAIEPAVKRLADAGVRVSLFIDADDKQLDAAARLRVPVVELHTGAYAYKQEADQRGVDQYGADQARELNRIRQAARYAKQLGLIVNAGHGLHYHNVQAIAAIPDIVELNIGHAIVARAVFDGFAHAVREMKQLMLQARSAAS